jgi:hypothetical protein
MRPTRKLQAGNLPLWCFPIWSFSERGFPCRRMSPPCAVVSYTTISPLPAVYKKHRRFVFCGTFRCLATPGRYPALCPPEFRLSSPFSKRGDRLVHSPQILYSSMALFASLSASRFNSLGICLTSTSSNSAINSLAHFQRAAILESRTRQFPFIWLARRDESV